MSNWIKQSTSVVISFGPFLDKTDGVTLETGLVSALDHASTGIKLSKNGGALTIRHATVTATTYDAYGMYRVTLDTTDTNTLGTLRIAFEEAATCLPVWQDFMVLPANVYDSLVGGTDALDVSAIQFAGQTITAAAGVTIPSSIASPTNITAATGIDITKILGTAISTPATAGILDVNLKNIANAAVSTSTAQLGVNLVNIAGNAASVSPTAGVLNTRLAEISVGGFISLQSVQISAVSGAVGSVTGNVGGNVTGSVGSVTAGVTVSTNSDKTGYSLTAGTGLGNQTSNITGNLSGSVGSVTAGVTLAASAVQAIWDALTSALTTVGSVGKRIADFLTGDAFVRLGAPVGASVSADIAAIKAETAATAIRSAIGLATANLDTQLGALPTAAENADAVWDEALSGHTTAGTAGGDVGQITTQVDGIYQMGGGDGSVSPNAAAPTTAAIADAVWDEDLSGHTTAGTAGKKLSDAGATPLDAAGVRAAIGLASANLDTQLDALPTAAEAGAATWEALRGDHATPGTFGQAVSGVTGNVGGSVLGNVSGSVGSVTAAVTLPTMPTDWITAAGLSTAAANEIAGAIPPLSGADVRTAIGLTAANLDAQLGAIAGYIDTEVAAIKAKTDNLPSDPASSTNVTAVYNRLGAPAGASMSADIAAVKAETATINTNTTAAAQRAAVGLASANLDTQLATIDTVVDGIKAVTDAGVTLADGAITDAKIAELAFMGKHFDNDIQIAEVTGAVGSVTAGVTVTTNNDKTGYALTSGERNSTADALLDRADGAVTGKTLREALSVLLAALGGKVSGAGTTTITFRHINDTKDVIVATVDTSGNRTAVTITP